MRVRVRTLLPPLLCLIRAHTHAPLCPEPLDDRPLPGPPAAPETARPARQPAPAHHLAGRRGVGPPGGEPGPGLRQAVRPAGGVNPAGICACPLCASASSVYGTLREAIARQLSAKGNARCAQECMGENERDWTKCQKGGRAHAHCQARAVPGDEHLHAHWLPKELLSCSTAPRASSPPLATCRGCGPQGLLRPDAQRGPEAAAAAAVSGACVAEAKHIPQGCGAER